MDWNQKIFAYCERGTNPAFWAEPLNAVSNMAFLIAAALAFIVWRREPAARRGIMELALVMLVAVIGTGSFLFHTYATRWAVIADTAPIGIFMIAYLGYALRRFAGLSWLVCGVGLAAFIGALAFAETIQCGGRPCLNGSIGYLPALMALAAIGGWLTWRGHPAAKLMLAGAALFAVSLTLRTLDRSICPATALFGGRQLGTHFLWHICNATLLYTLLIAAIRYGRRAEVKS